jgi:hypothetical protein
MNILILTALHILSILFLSKCTDNYSKNSIPDKIDFYQLSFKDLNCLTYYETNVIKNSSDIKNIMFYEYLEYWWNTEETETELLDRVCNFIYSKYPKKYIRSALNK